MTNKPPDLERLFKALELKYPAQARRNEALAGHTTLRLGGPADIWFPAKSIEQLVSAVSLARQNQVSTFILGGGANLLIQSAGIRGLVIENRANKVKFEGAKVMAHSGAIIPRLAKQCAQKGLGGLEWAVGIPGTIGGAVVNNAGAYGADIAGVLVKAELLHADGSRKWRPVSWFEYGYRSSKLKQGKKEAGPVVLQAELALKPASTTEVTALMNSYNERRKTTQPPGATVGSMFKNPPNDYAGRLIEAAGLKGFQVGQAQISPLHANFFVNLGGASGDDVIRLIQTAQERVKTQFGITLELEIEIV